MNTKNAEEVVEQAMVLQVALIGDLFPHVRLNGHEPLPPHAFDTRAFNVLRQNRCDTWAALSAVSVGELWVWRNSGAKTVRCILRAAFDRDLAMSAIADPDDALSEVPAPLPESEFDPPKGISESTPPLPQMNIDLDTLLQWASTQCEAATFGDVFAFRHDDATLSADVRLALDALTSLRIDTADYHDATASFLEALGEHSDIFVSRTIALSTPPTLQNLADLRGLTRERIRQIESRLVETARSLIDTHAHRVLRWRAARAKTLLGLGTLAYGPTHLAALSELTRGIDDSIDETTFALLVWLAGGYKCKGKWLLAESATAAELVALVDREMGDAWLVSTDELTAAAERCGIVASDTDELAALLDHWRYIGTGTWVRWNGSIGDKMEIVLHLVGAELTPEVINGHLGDGRSDNYVRNVLAQDDRFVRLGKSLVYALRAWGREEYSGVAQEIFERIERGGGRASLSAMTDEFVTAFGVQPNSVKAFAGTPAFVLEGDEVRLRRDDEPYEFDKAIAPVRGLYISPDGDVIMHFAVDADLARGSGRVIAPAAAHRLGVLPGVGTQFTAEGTGDSIVVGWSPTSVSGPTIGSLRAISQSLDARIGDVLRLAFSVNTASCRAELQRTEDLDGAVGFTIDGDPLAVLAEAIDAQPDSLHAWLATRGDELTLGLLPKHEASEGLITLVAEIDLLD